MKIAHLAPPWIAVPPCNYGGAEAAIYHLIEEQFAQGDDVTLFSPGDARTSARVVSFFPCSLIDTGVPWQAHLKAYYHYYKALEYVRNQQFDILHAHLSSSVDMCVYPLMSLLEIDTPLVTTLHSRFPFDRVDSWKGDADACYLEWLSSVPMVAISESARAEVPYPLRFVGVVYHGLPLVSFHPTAEQPEAFLIWLGRIIPDKGPHHAIDVARAVGMPLILAGTVDPHLGEAVQYFEEMIKPHLDGEQIKYVGPVDQYQKVDLLSRAKAFLNPIMWEEPFGIVMIEAMAMGCPVISFARGAAPELIAHGKSGFLVRDVQEMIDTVPLIDAIDRRTVRNYVEARFSVRVMADKYRKIYERVIMGSAISSISPQNGAVAQADRSNRALRIQRRQRRRLSRR